jgi:hypothetical protein
VTVCELVSAVGSEGRLAQNDGRSRPVSCRRAGGRFSSKAPVWGPMMSSLPGAPGAGNPCAAGEEDRLEPCQRAAWRGIAAAAMGCQRVPRISAHAAHHRLAGGVDIGQRQVYSLSFSRALW